MFLVLRCRPSDALKQLDAMRGSAKLGLPPEDIQCPTYRIERRVGRKRERIELDVPVLGNFLFMRWDGELYFAHYVERLFPFVSIMRLPHGGYATCSDKEVEAINKLPPLPAVDSPEWIADAFRYGDEVQVIPGTFLANIKGTVLEHKKDGTVRLKVTDSGGLKMSTLLVHGSLLTISVNASV